MVGSALACGCYITQAGGCEWGWGKQSEHLWSGGRVAAGGVGRRGEEREEGLCCGAMQSTHKQCRDMVKAHTKAQTHDT